MSVDHNDTFNKSLAVDPSCCVTDLFNVMKLQQVLNSLVTRLDRQTEKITELEKELSQRTVTWNDFQSFTTTVTNRIDKLEENINTWKANSQYDTLISKMSQFSGQLQNIQSIVAEKAQLSSVVKLEDKVLLCIDEIKNAKSSVMAINSLEDSQKAILQECVALQQLVACKVDKAEIPGLMVASERVQRAHEFIQIAAPKLVQLESAILNTARVVSLKEDKDTVMAKVEILQADINKKADSIWVENQVLQPLHQTTQTLQEDVQDLKSVRGQLDAAIAMSEMQKQTIQDAKQATYQMKQQMKEVSLDVVNLAQEISELPSQSTLLQSLDGQKVILTKEIETIQQHCAHDIRIHNNILLELRSQLLELTRHHTTMEKRVDVAVKFVDWFSDVKLKGDTFDKAF